MASVGESAAAAAARAAGAAGGMGVGAGHGGWAVRWFVAVWLSVCLWLSVFVFQDFENFGAGDLWCVDVFGDDGEEGREECAKGRFYTLLG